MEDLRRAYREGRLEKHPYAKLIHARHRILFDYSRYLVDSDVERIEIDANEVVVTSRSRQVKLVCLPDDEHLVPFTLLNFGSYEPLEVDVVLRLVQPRMRVFDVGANVGFYALVLARWVADLDIHCFEPMERTCRTLERNVALNAVRCVRAYKMGFADTDGAREFQYAPVCSGGTSLADLGQPGGVVPVTAPVHRMDTFCEKHDLWPDYVKCDVEGAELLVVKGAAAAIRRARPILQLELLRKWSARFGYHPNDVLDLLAGYGYRCFVAAEGGTLREFGRVTEETVETNYFFLHGEAHREAIARTAVPR